MSDDMPDCETPDDETDNTCPRCDGTGGDPMSDGCTPCEMCDGEGYRWWE